MYAQHFGLKKRPFRANATGTDVFVGPHIASIMAGLKKALTSSDAIVTVSGPVGSGKTTQVNRALESLGGNQKIVLIARMRLDSSDVIEFLLDELGVQERPNGAIQKFALFRRQLKDLADNGARLYIAVEDAVRLGADTLAEIEALTAADTGESDGASIVLMGEDILDTMLHEPSLARLEQRIRQRLTVAALPVAEMRGYLRHCFRLAGRDFEQIFEPNAADLLHHLSKGIPRVCNNLIESAMTTAADQDQAQVATTLLARVAENEYGLSAAGFELTTPAEADVEAAIPELAVEATASEPVAEDPVIVFAEPHNDAPQETQAANEIPELIQDTQPDLEILAPEPVTESSGNAVPAWDRDPTMAELKPDIAALEQAMAFAHGDDPDPVVADSEPVPEPEPEEPELIPEITLDHAISQRIESKLIDEPGEISAPAVDEALAPANDSDIPALDLPSKQNKKADVEIEKIAAELAKAKSIEDVGDKLAETLFGDEINFVAAQVLANPPSAEPANDERESLVATGQPAAAGKAAEEVEVTLEAPKNLDGGGIDLSASQRLKTVRALNADLHPSIREPEATVQSQASPTPAATPDSIEDQINTSMTQTLKALNVTPPVIGNDDDEESKNGFFNRFKRS